jgi:excisionase family DNA binding protein
MDLMADRDPMVEQIYTPNEVATLLGVAPVTVRQWAQKGLIEARTTAGGHRRFTRAAVVSFARRMGMTLPAELQTADDGPRILVVDDDRQFNGMLTALFRLRVRNATVASAFDGFEAGRAVQKFRPDLVVLDIMMPGMDGVDVCRALKSDPETATTRVVAMTGHHTIELEQRVLAAGAEALLKKPFHTDALLAVCGMTDMETV